MYSIITPKDMIHRQISIKDYKYIKDSSFFKYVCTCPFIVLHVLFFSLEVICHKMRDEKKGKNCLHNVYLSLNRHKMNYLIYMVCLGLNLMNINHLENYIIIFTAAEGFAWVSFHF